MQGKGKRFQEGSTRGGHLCVTCRSVWQDQNGIKWSTFF